MVKNPKNVDEKIKDLEKRMDKIESSFNPKKIGKITLIIGIIIFVLSFFTGEVFYGSLDFLSLGTIGFVLFVVGLVFLITSHSIQTREEKVPISRLDLVKEKEIIKKEIEPKPREKKEPQTYGYDAIKRFLDQYMPKKKKEDLETNIGVKWFARIGIVSLVIGMIFFLKYAFDNDWIGPIGRVSIGVVVGLILLGLGEFFDRKDYVLYSRALTGGGFAVLYGSIYAAHNFYSLISLFIDIMLLSVIILLGIIFAIKYKSRVIAYTSFLLGYLTAYLTGETNIHTLIYSTILTLGLLVLVYKKGWKYLGLGGIIATYVIHSVWLGSNTESHLTHLIFLAIYLVIFGFMSLRLKDYVKFKKEKELTLTSKTMVSAIFLLSFIFTFVSRPVNINYLFFYLFLALGLLFVVFKNNWAEIGVAGTLATYISFIVWYIANFDNPRLFLYTSIFLTIYFLLYVVLSFLIGVTEKEKPLIGNIIMTLINSFLYFGIMYYELKQNYDNLTGLFTLGVAVFYLILTFIAYHQKIKSLFITNLVLSVTYLTLTIPVQLNKEWITISWAIEGLILIFLGIKLKNLTLRILGYIVGAVTLIKTLVIDSYTLQVFDFNNILASTRLFVFLAAIISFYLCSVLLYKNKNVLKKEENNFASIFGINNASLSVAAVFGVIATILTTVMLFLEGKDWSSLWWALQTFAILVVGVVLNNQELRYSSYALGGITTLKLVVYDWALREFQFNDIVGSIRLIVYLSAIVIFYISARICNNKIINKREKAFATIGYDVVATLLATVLLALEFKKDWTSVAWAVFAIGLLVVGFGSKNRTFRLLGILLFAITILKVFIIDFRDLELFFRIITFIGLGIILLVAAFIYHKYKERIKELI